MAGPNFILYRLNEAATLIKEFPGLGYVFNTIAVDRLDVDLHEVAAFVRKLGPDDDDLKRNTQKAIWAAFGYTPSERKDATASASRADIARRFKEEYYGGTRKKGVSMDEYIELVVGLKRDFGSIVVCSALNPYNIHNARPFITKAIDAGLTADTIKELMYADDLLDSFTEE